MRSLDDRHGGRIRRQHPPGNFQTPVGGIDDTDRTVAPLWSPNDPQGHASKWVERIEDVNRRAVDTQGIVGASGGIHTYTASCPQADWHRITGDGSDHSTPGSFSR